MSREVSYRILICYTKQNLKLNKKNINIKIKKKNLLAESTTLTTKKRYHTIEFVTSLPNIIKNLI